MPSRPATAGPRPTCCRSSTTSCGSSPPRGWRPNRPTRPFSPPPWSTRRTSGWSAPPTECGGTNRGHFFAAAAEAMRRILVDAARRKRTEKHGGRRHRVELADVPADPEDPDELLLALDAALTRLAAEDPVAARVVELRHFAGLGHERGRRGPRRHRVPARQKWTYARAWLRDAVGRIECRDSSTAATRRSRIEGVAPSESRHARRPESRPSRSSSLPSRCRTPALRTRTWTGSLRRRRRTPGPGRGAAPRPRPGRQFPRHAGRRADRPGPRQDAGI